MNSKSTEGKKKKKKKKGWVKLMGNGWLGRMHVVEKKTFVYLAVYSFFLFFVSYIFIC
ncbi:hypothetical protein L873DRAFT_1813741 [Choiromyces venosus 120613-1]|uniref:Uncharacterized protein n=1 Tax=Choiromyces venosus 120613-1 TaxID=1336337 RepID=A0A3N4J9F1_9PEZI|nr:hypothetical protein L873DRAFT_1813741 [Choiromyces venosus 120613-1]